MARRIYCRRPGTGFGFTLIEVILSVGLLAVGLLFVLSIIPASVLALKKAEDMQAAAAYGLMMIEDARAHLPTHAGVDRELDVPINRTTFHVVREIFDVDPDLVDVVVLASWSRDYPPLRLNTRMRRKR